MPGELADPDRPTAERIFTDRLGLCERYARFLAEQGLERGLLGPREADRIWDRHLFNSAVLAEVIPDAANVVDVGSGAGLPGIPLALSRPDLHVVLLEPKLRRVAFLEEVIATLGLDGAVTVVRGRAPEDAVALPFSADYAVARAVAPLERLVSWTMPLVRTHGALLALRGDTAATEAREAEVEVRRISGSAPELLTVGASVLTRGVTVVRVARAMSTPSPVRARQGRS